MSDKVRDRHRRFSAGGVAILIAFPLFATAIGDSPGSRAPGTRPGDSIPPVVSDPGRSIAGREPTVRVGIAVDREHVSVSSPAGLRFTDALTGQEAGAAPPGVAVPFVTEEGLLRTERGTPLVPAVLPSIVAHPAGEGGPVFVDGGPYRGSVELRAARGELVTAVNIVPLEEYLLGVVPLEIGPRQPEEQAAVEAQAVAARTYAIAHLGARAEMGFDLYGSVADQVYGGMRVERDEATRAVRATEGGILLYEGRPIRAFYHSTCGGLTAPVEEVLDREPAPYLRAVSDRAPDGTDYCAASPRYRWSVTWTHAELDRVVRPELAAYFGVRPSDLGPVSEIAVVGRTATGRVRDLAFRGRGIELVVNRLEIRRALVHDGNILNSTDFDIADRGDGLVELYGRGYGHGAGLCQWGAIGRARAGQGHEEILATYYPGTSLVIAYGGDRG